MKQELSKPISGTALKLCVKTGIAVARFRTMAARTRLLRKESVAKNLTEERFNKHLRLWKRYGWIK